MIEAAIGLGANLGDRRRALRAGLFDIGLPILAVSSLYESAPVETDPQQPRYLNAVAIVDCPSGLRPEDLLEELLRVEAAHGRVRGPGKAPRTLDLDLLLFGREERSAERLVLPHPGILRRRFVLEPLLEVRPDVQVPGDGPARAQLAACKSQDVVRVAGRCWWWRIDT
jgi:2-amino-4-hydroxy-6-hydroxymethyldihydropteridine diphosphokinase